MCSDKGSCHSCAGVISQSNFGVEGRLQRNSAHTRNNGRPGRSARARDMRALRSAGQAARCLIVERCGRRQGKIDEVTFLFRPTTISEREYLSSDIFQLNTFSPQCTISPGRQLSPTISEVTFFHRRNFPSGICQTTFSNKFTSAHNFPGRQLSPGQFPRSKKTPM